MHQHLHQIAEKWLDLFRDFAAGLAIIAAGFWLSLILHLLKII